MIGRISKKMKISEAGIVLIADALVFLIMYTVAFRLTILFTSVLWLRIILAVPVYLIILGIMSFVFYVLYSFWYKVLKCKKEVKE